MFQTSFGATQNTHLILNENFPPKIVTFIRYCGQSSVVPDRPQMMIIIIIIIIIIYLFIYFIYLLQLGCHPVAVVILHVNKI